MSWLFSQALVAAYSEATCSDGAPSAPSSGSHTPQAYLSPDKMTAFSRLSRFGMTFSPLMGDRGEAVSMWFREDSRARTSVLPEQAKGLTENGQDSGQKWPASLAKYDPSTHSLRTAQLSLLGDSIESCVTLPRSGTMRNGECFQRPTLAPPMIESDSGSLRERFPTPTVCGNYNKKGLTAKSGDGLATYVRKFPTPTATAYKGWSPNHNRADTDDRIDYTIEREAAKAGKPGRLNPTWEEWLMAWPLEWTALKPLGTDRFLEWQRQHSPNSVRAEDGDQ